MLHRLHARLAMFARPATGFITPPEPRSIGHYARGKQLIAGNILFAGTLVPAPGTGLFRISPPDAAFADEMQGFAWLDDLAAVGDVPAQRRAQDWTWDWIARYGAGAGPGWTPDLTGRRLIRWINHGVFLLDGRDAAQTRAYFRALSRQTLFLSRRWQAAAPGLPRIEALTGLISARLALAGMERRVGPAMAALARDCARGVDADGGIPTRNPEELLEVFALLTWAAEALHGANRQPAAEHLAAIARIAPTLRLLRHADGGLARFHGGGRGLEGRLDQALAASGVRAAPAEGMAMGFARLTGGRTSVIVDAAAPPEGRASGAAHASTLAFELTSGRRPLVVSCGSGVPFGADWRRAGRATASHSTLALDGFSSSRLAPAARRRPGQPDLMTDRAMVLQPRLTAGAAGTSFSAAHDGWSVTHGVTHARELYLSADGRSLRGEDILGALTTAEQKRLDRVLAAAPDEGLRFHLRFHLHPDVKAAVDLGGSTVSIVLKSGEVWLFRHDGAAELSVEPSVYLEKGRLKPRACRQIVLAAALTGSACQIDWTLGKAQGTPLAIRDLDREDLPVEL